MSLKLRYYFRFTKAFLLRFKGILFFGILIGVVLFLFLSIILPKILPRSKEVVGIQGKFRSDDLPLEIQNMISEGLTSIDENDNVQNSLSTSWETPDSGKTWTFKLDPDAIWQDGEKVLSTDIKYSFSDVEIEYPDENTITFKLKDPFVPFPSVVSLPVFKKGLLGTGEWEVENLNVAGGYVEELKIKNKKGDRKIYKFYPTEDKLKTAFKLGYIQKIDNLINPQPFDKWSTTKISEKINNKNVVVIFLNTKDKILSEKSLRQVLNYAIDKNSLSPNRAYSPIDPSSWAYNPQVKPYQYSTDRAKELIKDLPKEFKESISIDLVSSPILISTAEKIVKYWSEIGIKSNLQVSSIVPENPQAYITILDIPTDPDQYTLWHSTQTSSNITKYSSPRIDKILEDGRSTLNLDERKKLYIDFQRYLLEDCPAIFLYHPTYYTVERK